MSACTLEAAMRDSIVSSSLARADIRDLTFWFVDFLAAAFIIIDFMLKLLKPDDFFKWGCGVHYQIADMVRQMIDLVSYRLP